MIVSRRPWYILLLTASSNNRVLLLFHTSSSSTTAVALSMPRGVKKENLPTKICVTCQRPFTWRKKWERCWDEVTTCSKSCNQKRRQQNSNNNKASPKSVLSSLDNPKRSRQRYQEDDDDDSLRWSMKESKQTAHMSQTLELEMIPYDEISVPLVMQDEDDEKARRKAAKKALKAARRAQREDPSTGQKQCDVCYKSVNLLIRCQVDASATWQMVCGSCWHGVSGGVVDGDADHPYYRYGGLWKNRKATKIK